MSVLGKLRGFSQGCLVQADDGRLYVLKMYPHPFSSDSLANEAIGTTLLAKLGVPVPTWRPLLLTSENISRFPALGFQMVGRIREPCPGLQFASEYLAGPDNTIVDIRAGSKDFIVVNTTDLLDVYIFDIWANHRDRRQYIYSAERQTGFARMFFIDNSHLFGRRSWAECNEEEEHSCNTWTKPLTLSYDRQLGRRVQQFRRRMPELLRSTLAEAPSEWHGSDIGLLEECLLDRLRRLRELIEENLAFHGISSVPCQEDN